MIITLENTWAKVTYQDEPTSQRDKINNYLDQKMAVPIPGAEFAPSVRTGHWDGMKHFYDLKTQQFPTGNIKKAQDLLDKVKYSLDFDYQVVDDRPDPFVDYKDIPDTIKINKQGELLTLRDYQVEGVKAVFKTGNGGILHLSVGSGKCYPADTNILTNDGYQTIGAILKRSLKEHPTIGNYVKPYTGLKVINRYGKQEQPGLITINGVKPLLRVTTQSGLTERITPNHPLLVQRDKQPIWVPANELKLGDYLVTRTSTNAFGTGHLPFNTAYALGAIIADGYVGDPKYISFTTGAKPVAEEVFKFFNGVKNTREPHWDKWNHTWNVELNSKRLVPVMRSKYNISLGVAKDKYVPSVIMGADKSTQLAFLSGYLECEISYDKVKHGSEVTSASKTLISQVSLLLRNLGVYNTLHKKFVPAYPDNYYGRISIARTGTVKLLSMLTFVTEQRQKQTTNAVQQSIEHPIKQEAHHFLPLPNEILASYYRKTALAYPGTSNSRRKYFGASSNDTTTRRLGTKQVRKGIMMYPVDCPEFTILDQLTQPEVRYDEITAISEVPAEETYDLSVPGTHSFIANGLINHNTLAAAAIIKILVPKLEKGERVLFFTNNKEIFNQDIDNLADALQMKIGFLGGGKKRMAKVMVCMIPTVASYLKIDPEAGLTLTPKEHQVKKMATIYADKFLTATNPYQQLKTFINLFTPIKKVDQVTYKLLEEVRDTCGSNQDVINAFHDYQEQYRQLINTKASAKVKKANFIHDLLDSCVAFIGDEVQHTKADTWYTTMLACENAIYKVGLTGSIDPNDELMVTRLQSVFGEVVARVKSKELIDKGILAKPKILMIPIREPDTIANNKKWQEVYKFGIVENEYRNKVIAALAARWYGEGKTVLIIVKELAHMDYLSSMLDSVQIPHELINGTQQDEDRKQELVNIKDGSNRVLIATSVLDEGVDIANIDTLILAAGGKSLRQVIQRVGRVLRKKVGKENKALIVDFDDRENLYLRNHSQNRMQIYKQEQFEVTQVEG